MLRLALPTTRAVAPLFSRSFGSTLQRLSDAPKAGSKAPKKAEAPAAPAAAAAAPAAAAPKGKFEFPEDAVFGAPARYVKGLFELAQKNGHLDELRAELNKVAQVARSDVSFRDGLKRGNIDAGYSDYVTILLSELKARQKTKLFNQIVEGFENACRDVYNEVHITVTVPNELPKNEIEKIAQEFCENYVKNSCKLVMTVDVDPSILGGRIYQIDDIIVDLSEKLIVDGWIAKKAEEQARLLDAQKVGTINEVPIVSVPSRDAATKAAAADYAGYSFRLPAKSAH